MMKIRVYLHHRFMKPKGSQLMLVLDGDIEDKIYILDSSKETTNEEFWKAFRERFHYDENYQLDTL